MDQNLALFVRRHVRHDLPAIKIAVKGASLNNVRIVLLKQLLLRICPQVLLQPVHLDAPKEVYVVAPLAALRLAILRQSLALAKVVTLPQKLIRHLVLVAFLRKMVGIRHQIGEHLCKNGQICADVL